jgi:DNA phosphorothioation-associated putative methyltransferase
LSLPVKNAIRDGILAPGCSVFDYGCGRGEDVRLLNDLGFPCRGWDPAFFPDAAREEADIVNLGYVINVIESQEERDATLLAAWALCRRVLIASAQILVSGRGASQVEFGDGVLTSRNTFQRYFRQDELKSYLEAVLGREAVPAALGVFYVFRDEAAGQEFLSRRYRRRIAVPPGELDKTRFETYRELLIPFMGKAAELGRLPEPDECPNAAELIDRFGSLKRAFAVVKRATGDDEWEASTKRVSEDLLVYLALGKFQGRPPLSVLPLGLQRDIKAFFRSYKSACNTADTLLFRAGDAAAVDEACRQSKAGKLLPEAIYVHMSALELLDPLLRVYEGCGRAYLGEIEGANLVKIHRRSGQLSYLVYPEFEIDPHPSLARSVKLSLRTREIECLDYVASANPPILHRKETFLHPEHPLHDRFSRLTRQEESHGLLNDPSGIGTRSAWEERLRSRGFVIRGHRLMQARADGAEDSDSDVASG